MPLIGLGDKYTHIYIYRRSLFWNNILSTPPSLSYYFSFLLLVLVTKEMLQNQLSVDLYNECGKKDCWVIMEDDDDHHHHHHDQDQDHDDRKYNPTTSTSSSIGNSTSSHRSTSSSSDLVDDASSSSCSSSHSNGPLFELSELMAQLPIK